MAISDPLPAAGDDHALSPSFPEEPELPLLEPATASDTKRRRGGNGPERRCIATRQSGPRRGLIRFVLDPDRRLVPDLAERLGGRGVYVSAERHALETAVAKRLFNRAARGPVSVPDDLPGMLAELLRQRLMQTLGLCRRAGILTYSAEKVRARLTEPGASPALVLVAQDAGRDGREKLGRLAGHRAVPVIAPLSGQQLGQALGRDVVVHLSLEPNPLSERVARDALRLAAVMGLDPAELPSPPTDPPDGQAPHG